MPRFRCLTAISHPLTSAPRRCAHYSNMDITAHKQDAFGFPRRISRAETQRAATAARLKKSAVRRKMNSLAILLFDEISVFAGVLVCPTNNITRSHLCRYRTIAPRLLEPLNGWVIAIFWRRRSTPRSRSGYLPRSIGIAKMSHEQIGTL